MAVSNVKRILLENPPAEEFEPYYHFNKEADALTFYFKGDADYSKRLTDHVTVFISISTDELVGCRIKGISDILEDLPNYLRINHGEVELSILFLSFRGAMEDANARETLNRLAHEASKRSMKLEPA